MPLNQPRTNGILLFTAGEAIEKGTIVRFMDPSEVYDGKLYSCGDWTSAYQVPFGVALEDAEADQEFAVATFSGLSGTVLIKAQAAITKVGHALCPNIGVREYNFAEAYPTWIIGTALQSGVSGEFIEVLPQTPQFVQLNP